MILINPVVDLVLGGATGLVFYFQVTDSWWTAPILLRRLFGR